jgi:hypothetical protein
MGISNRRTVSKYGKFSAWICISMAPGHTRELHPPSAPHMLLLSHTCTMYYTTCIPPTTQIKVIVHVHVYIKGVVHVYMAMATFGYHPVGRAIMQSCVVLHTALTTSIMHAGWPVVGRAWALSLSLSNHRWSKLNKHKLIMTSQQSPSLY